MFSFEPGIAIWAVIAFLIVLYVIQNKVYPPIRKIMDERRDEIAQSLARTSEEKSAAIKLREELTEKLLDIKLQEERVLSGAREKAKKLYAEEEHKLNEKLKELQKRKEQELADHEKAFIQQTEKKIIAMIISSCEKVMQIELTPEIKAIILQKRIEDLSKLEEF